ncbi:MAG TPA: hypothetical protein VG106_14390 [Vicinamibacterales bacterium]|nr:hypothetical protein [Vicinamibacterales bacterium]
MRRQASLASGQPWKDRFWLTERLYFEALAAAIGSLEVFEQEQKTETREETA